MENNALKIRRNVNKLFGMKSIPNLKDTTKINDLVDKLYKEKNKKAIFDICKEYINIMLDESIDINDIFCAIYNTLFRLDVQVTNEDVNNLLSAVISERYTINSKAPLKEKPIEKKEEPLKEKPTEKINTVKEAPKFKQDSNAAKEQSTSSSDNKNKPNKEPVVAASNLANKKVPIENIVNILTNKQPQSVKPETKTVPVKDPVDIKFNEVKKHINFIKDNHTGVNALGEVELNGLIALINNPLLRQTMKSRKAIREKGKPYMNEVKLVQGIGNPMFNIAFEIPTKDGTPISVKAGYYQYNFNGNIMYPLEIN